MADVNNTPKEGGKGKSKKQSTSIDMTPMVDLAFLLLTFFMLATSFTKPQTMEIAMPLKPKTTEEQPLVNEKRVLTLVLGPHDKVYWYVGQTTPEVEETDFSADGVRQVLFEQNKIIKNMMVLIKPMEGSRYKNVVDILDEMNITQTQRYALVDITPEDLALVN